jgi:putative DNA-invertase from lambdoid prophage Rac
LYARVSTHDQQTLPLQIRALREYAAKRGWTIVAQIKEVGSGASQRQLRESLLATARRRQIDVVMVWRLDRWAGPSRTWYRHSRNFSISAWDSCLLPRHSI